MMFKPPFYGQILRAKDDFNTGTPGNLTGFGWTKQAGTANILSTSLGTAYSQDGTSKTATYTIGNHWANRIIRCKCKALVAAARSGISIWNSGSKVGSVVYVIQNGANDDIVLLQDYGTPTSSVLASLSVNGSQRTIVLKTSGSTLYWDIDNGTATGSNALTQVRTNTPSGLYYVGPVIGAGHFSEWQNYEVRNYAR